jgi:hypothetical protein
MREGFPGFLLIIGYGIVVFAVEIAIALIANPKCSFLGYIEAYFKALFHKEYCEGLRDRDYVVVWLWITASAFSLAGLTNEEMRGKFKRKYVVMVWIVAMACITIIEVSGLAAVAFVGLIIIACPCVIIKPMSSTNQVSSDGVIELPRISTEDIPASNQSSSQRIFEV